MRRFPFLGQLSSRARYLRKIIQEIRALTGILRSLNTIVKIFTQILLGRPVGWINVVNYITEFQTGFISTLLNTRISRVF